MTRETRAQALVLESILTHRPLPGVDRAVSFLDLGLHNHDPQVVLVDDRDPSELGFPSQLRIISRDKLDTIRSERELRLLEFLQPEHFPGKISVRVQLSIALPNDDPMPLEGIVATFNDSDPLTAVEPTHVLAY
jgi:hypothetical protein